MEEPRAVLAAILSANQGWCAAYERGRVETTRISNSTDIDVLLCISPTSTLDYPSLGLGGGVDCADVRLQRWLCRYSAGDMIPRQSHCSVRLQNRPGILITPLRFKLRDLTCSSVHLPSIACLVIQESRDHVPLNFMKFHGAISPVLKSVCSLRILLSVYSHCRVLTSGFV